ncbi:MAG: tetratricopeptide repeat protein [Treponema sp.]|nr:tetratricopeptide repeat protein [Treponema sp.]
MKKSPLKIIFTWTVFFAAASSLTFTSCSQSYKSIKRMQKMEEGVENPTTKEELKEAIEKYDARAIDLATTESQVGMWYKILGTRYLDEQEYGKAYEAFQKALVTFPNNQNLYYYIAVCATYIANAQLDFDGKGTFDEDGFSYEARKENYLKTAEKAYLTALEIDAKYYKAMYGLSVLYVFQMFECEKAIPYLEKFLSVQKKDTNAMFVLARAYFVTGEFSKATELYDKIIEINPNAEKTADAKRNKQIVLDAQYSN